MKKEERVDDDDDDDDEDGVESASYCRPELV